MHEFFHTTVQLSVSTHTHTHALIKAGEQVETVELCVCITLFPSHAHSHVQPDVHLLLEPYLPLLVCLHVCVRVCVHTCCARGSSLFNSNFTNNEKQAGLEVWPADGPVKEIHSQ